MAKVMVTIQALEGPPTIAELCERYDLREDDFDPRFGVVEIDPADHLYTVLVEDHAAAKIEPTDDWDVSGPYSNPRIAPFGPPEPDDDTAEDIAEPAPDPASDGEE